jgi:hypothetical protein
MSLGNIDIYQIAIRNMELLKGTGKRMNEEALLAAAKRVHILHTSQ